MKEFNIRRVRNGWTLSEYAYKSNTVEPDPYVFITARELSLFVEKLAEESMPTTDKGE